MAQRHLDPTDPAAREPADVPAPSERHGVPRVPTGDALAEYLRAQATEFLRALRLHRETGGGVLAARAEVTAAVRAGEAGGADGDAVTADSAGAARALRRSARRISGSLHTFRPLLDSAWSEEMRTELAWLSGTLGQEHAYAARLERLLLALHRLSGATVFPPRSTAVTASATAPVAAAVAPVPPAGATVPDGSSPRAAGGRPAGGGVQAPERGSLTVGAAKAGALLDRQLTLARTRAHSGALQALGSSRFHAVADKVALLASEVPLTPAAPDADLRPLAAAAEDRLTAAAAALPLVTAGHPYNAEALVHGLSPDPAPHPQDGPWHQVRLLMRLYRYAREALGDDGLPADTGLLAAGHALDRHRDASEAAAASAQAARTPRIAPATAYALGVLHADQRHEVEAARFAFQQSWQKQTVGAP